MTTMNEIKKMTGEELADFLTGEFYEGCEDGLFFITEIEDHEIKYTLGLDNRGIVSGALRLGLLQGWPLLEYFLLARPRSLDHLDIDDLDDDEIRELSEIYWYYEDEIDREAIEFMRDEIIEDLEKELEEIKKWED